MLSSVKKLLWLMESKERGNSTIANSPSLVITDPITSLFKLGEALAINNLR